MMRRFEDRLNIFYGIFLWSVVVIIAGLLLGCTTLKVGKSCTTPTYYDNLTKRTCYPAVIIR